MKNFVNSINFIILFYVVSIIGSFNFLTDTGNKNDFGIYSKEEGSCDVARLQISDILVDDEQFVLNTIITYNRNAEFLLPVETKGYESGFYYFRKFVWHEADVSPPELCYF